MDFTAKIWKKVTDAFLNMITVDIDFGLSLPELDEEDCIPTVNVIESVNQEIRNEPVTTQVHLELLARYTAQETLDPGFLAFLYCNPFYMATLKENDLLAFNDHLTEGVYDTSTHIGFKTSARHLLKNDQIMDELYAFMKENYAAIKQFTFAELQGFKSYDSVAQGLCAFFMKLVKIKTDFRRARPEDRRHMASDVITSDMFKILPKSERHDMAKFVNQVFKAA